MDIIYKSLIRCIHVPWKIETSHKELVQVGEGKVALKNTEIQQENVIYVESMGINE